MHILFDAVCFTDLVQDSEMIIFESIWTTFIASVVYKDSWGISKKKWLELKIEHPQANLDCLNWCTHCIKWNENIFP